MKKSIFMMSLVSVLLMTSCVSKKELVACQEENKALQANYMEAKEQLAASNARATSLEQQMKQQARSTAALQRSLDKSLTNASQNNISIEKLVDQSMSQTSTSATWWR
jgi:chemotaxis protein MotB